MQAARVPELARIPEMNFTTRLYETYIDYIEGLALLVLIFFA
jgi:hypothetical protein